MNCKACCIRGDKCGIRVACANTRRIAVVNSQFSVVHTHPLRSHSAMMGVLIETYKGTYVWSYGSLPMRLSVYASLRQRVGVV